MNPSPSHSKTSAAQKPLTSRQSVASSHLRSVALHNLPIDPIPPGLQERLLPGHAPLRQPAMLPSRHTKQRRQILPARRNVGAVTANEAHRSRPQVEHVVVLHRVRLFGHAAVDAGVGRRQVAALLPEMGAGVGGAGEVGGEEGEVADAAAVGGGGVDQPDEAGAEHGVGGGEEGGAEAGDGGEGLGDFGEEGGGEGDLIGGL